MMNDARESFFWISKRVLNRVFTSKNLEIKHAMEPKVPTSVPDTSLEINLANDISRELTAELARWVPM